MLNIVELQKLIQTNEISYWLIVTIICSVFCTLIDIFIFLNIFKIKMKPVKKIGMIFTDIIIRVIVSIFIEPPYYRAFDIIFTIIIFKIFTNERIEKCVLGEVINAITIIAAESMFSKLFCELFSNVQTYKLGMFDYRYKFSLWFSISVFRFIIFLIIKKKNLTVKLSENMNKRDRYSVLIVSLVGVIIIFFNAVEMVIFISDFPYLFFVLDIVSLILYFYISMKNILRISKIEAQNMKIENLEQYNKTLSIMYDNIRGFRHDYSNVVQALCGYADTGNMEGIRRMCNSMFKECKCVKNMGILDPEILKNPAMYSIITNKFFAAQEKGIEMNIDILADMKSVEEYNYEVCKIFAILLDNAIEAAEKTKEKVVNVRFEKDRKVKRKLIIIENSFSGDKMDLDKIFEKGYTSKKYESGEHGLGLWNVRKILNSMENLNLYTCQNELFCQQLEIY